MIFIAYKQILFQIYKFFRKYKTLKMNAFIIYLRHLKLRTQLILFSTLTISAIMLLVIVISNLQIELMFQIQGAASKYAAQQQVWNEMVSIQKQQVQLIENFAEIVKKQMKIVNKLLNSKLPDIFYDQQFYLEQQYLFKTINLSNPYQIEMKNNLNLVEEWLPLIYNYDLIIPVNEIYWITSDNIFTFYNYNNSMINYYTKIEEQYWYLNWLWIANLTLDKQSVLSFQYVNPFLPQYCSLSAGLFDNSQNFSGIISSQYLLQDYLQIFNKLQINNLGIQYILTTDGKFIYTFEDGSVSLQDFYNQSLTGFDKDDWNAIKSNNFSNSNCQGFSGTQMLCRYNSLYKMNTIISCHIVLKQQLYFISIAEQVKYLNYIDDFFRQFSQEIQQYQESFIIFYSLATLLTIFITGVLITILLKPLDFISYDIIVQSFKKDKFKDIVYFKQKNMLKQFQFGSLSYLIKAYRHLTDVNQIAKKSKIFNTPKKILLIIVDQRSFNINRIKQKVKKSRMNILQNQSCNQDSQAHENTVQMGIVL
ncbi:hypothetical protein pb186bvf_011979 [Paramecium bursaria]